MLLGGDYYAFVMGGFYLIVVKWLVAKVVVIIRYGGGDFLVSGLHAKA